MAEIRLAVMGRPTVAVDGAPSPIGSLPLQLLVRLAVEPSRAVGAGRLVDDLWPDTRVSDSTLRVLVSRARAVVGSEHLAHRHGAYELVGVATDVDDFERDLVLARESSAPAAQRLLDYERALRAHRGPALDGMREPAWAVPVAHRLDELVEQALDEWGQLALDLGHHGRVGVDLGAALSRTPTRERRCELVARAHYRNGEQTAALRTIDLTRRALRDELGLSMGRTLSDLESRILAHLPDDVAHVATPARSGTLSVETRIRSVSSLLQLGALEEAEAMLDTAEAALDRRPVGREHGLAALARARWEMAAGHGDPHVHIDRAQDVARTLRDGRLLAGAAAVRFAAGAPDDTTDALAELLEPLHLLPNDAEERIELLGIAAAITNFGDAGESARRLAEEARRVDAHVGSDRSRATVMAIESMVTSIDRDSIDRTEQHASSALDAARRLGDDTLFVTAAHAMLRVHFARGRFDEIERLLVDLDLAGRRAVMPIVAIRPPLCRSTIALARGDFAAAANHTADAGRIGDASRAFGTNSAPKVQELMLALERDDPALLATVRTMAEIMPDTVWEAVAAAVGDDERARRLRDVADRVARDDYHSTFCAFAAMTAARTGDERLGAWCLDELAEGSDHTVVVGLGTLDLGFVPHFRALALVGCGRFDEALAEFGRALELASGVGARAWWCHSLVERASVRHAARMRPVAGDRRELRRLAQAAPTPRLARRAHEVLDAMATDDVARSGGEAAGG